MMRNVLGALLGAAIDRRDGDTGVRGLVLGAILPRLMRRSPPLAIALLAGVAAKSVLDARRRDRASRRARSVGAARAQTTPQAPSS